MTDPYLGLLPANAKSGRGQGYVSFKVKSAAALPGGTQIANQASIVFDFNAPIVTNATLNTLDGVAPASTVAALPAESPASFLMQWSRSDGAGSGIAGYDVYVSLELGPFSLWQTGTTLTETLYAAQPGPTCGFYSVATDSVHNRQPAPGTAQATTPRRPGWTGLVAGAAAANTAPAGARGRRVSHGCRPLAGPSSRGVMRVPA